jgi:hypothetical protein
MSRSVSCALCGREVDDADCVPMPTGLVCADPCYEWLERMMEEAEELDGDEEIIVVFEPEEEWYD